jgi:hypothetical protein
MGSSRKRKSVRRKSDRHGERRPSREILLDASNQAQAKILEFPPGLKNEIENQRGVLVTIITLLHCLHVALKYREDQIDEGLDPRVEAGVRWVSLPEMTATILERTHAVLSSLDSSNLARALKAAKP